MIEIITINGIQAAIIISNEYRDPGIHFFTQDTDTLQLGYMLRPGGYKIAPHFHLPATRTVLFTNEVLFIKSGVVRVNFYHEDRNFYEYRILKTGDTILLTGCGHGFDILEESEIIEVKQGPYAGHNDKLRFESL